MICFDHVTKAFARGGVKAVDDLCLEITEGKVMGFLGPNGAGKTTTIRLMTGILAPDSGSITVNGHAMADEPLACKQLIGFVPDGQDAFDRLTGLQYLTFMANIYGVDQQSRDRLIPEYLEKFEMKQAAGEQMRAYSKGMRQKMVVIGALLHQPPVWVLDEPMSGLDPRSMHILKEEMRRHCDAGNIVFFSTHVLDVAEKLCDELAIINKGRLIAKGTLEQLRSGEQGASLEQLFLELTDTEEDRA